MILDEPTAGVDFELRIELWSYIRRLHAAGTTILLTTHYLDEAEALCEEIALIRHGRLIARDTAAGLRAHYGASRSRTSTSRRWEWARASANPLEPKRVARVEPARRRVDVDLDEAGGGTPPPVGDHYRVAHPSDPL